jgi:transposase
LSRHDVLHDVAPEEQNCSCGCTKTRFGEDVTERLDYIPGRIVERRHIYPKYACSCCKDAVTAAQPVPNPVARCLVAPGLLAFVVVSKYSKHLPLHRQRDICSGPASMAGSAKSEKPNGSADHGSLIAPSDRAPPPGESRERSRHGLP